MTCKPLALLLAAAAGVASCGSEATEMPSTGAMLRSMAAVQEPLRLELAAGVPFGASPGQVDSIMATKAHVRPAAADESTVATLRYDGGTYGPLPVRTWTFMFRDERLVQAELEIDLRRAEYAVDEVYARAEAMIEEFFDGGRGVAEPEVHVKVRRWEYANGHIILQQHAPRADTLGVPTRHSMHLIVRSDDASRPID